MHRGTDGGQSTGGGGGQSRGGGGGGGGQSLRTALRTISIILQNRFCESLTGDQ